LWRTYLLWKLPSDYIKISSFGIEEKMQIPPRPGVQGIVITGPIIEPLYFSIDLSKAGVRELNWRKLQQIDAHADVKISCVINEKGYLVFSQSDVLMEGHTEAGMMIQRVLKTWIFTPYKTGIIRFWFNLPSKGEKLIIDTSGLERKRTIDSDIPIYNGRLYYIEGIPTNEIQVGIKV
jgi:hypothetical protein